MKSLSLILGMIVSTNVFASSPYQGAQAHFLKDVIVTAGTTSTDLQVEAGTVRECHIDFNYSTEVDFNFRNLRLTVVKATEIDATEALDLDFSPEYRKLTLMLANSSYLVCTGKYFVYSALKPIDVITALSAAGVVLLK